MLRAWARSGHGLGAGLGPRAAQSADMPAFRPSERGLGPVPEIQGKPASHFAPPLGCVPSAYLATLGEQIDALLRDPTSDVLLAQLRECAENEQAPRPFARALVDRAATLVAVKPEAAVASLAEAAQLYEDALGELPLAAEQWQAVLRLQPRHRQALFSLGLLLYELQRWNELVALYRRRLEDCEDHNEQATLHLYIAELLSDRMEDANGAFEEVMKAARLCPTNLRIVSRLEQLGERAGRVADVAVTIGDLIMQQDDPKTRAALSLRLAELHLGTLQDEARALTYLRSALHDDGGNPALLGEVEDMFREQERFDDLAQVLEESTTERRIGPHWVRLRRELARIFERELDQPQHALRSLMKALPSAPEDRELLDEVQRLSQLTGDHATLAQAYEQALEATERALFKTFLRLRLGQLYANKLDRPEEARRVYWAILRDAPDHEDARRRLLRIYEALPPCPELAVLLELEARALPPDEAPPVWERLAALYDGPLQAPEAAAQARAHQAGHPFSTFDIPD